ncbi:MAG: serine/threonine-protein kinase [Myxococcota bacterium]|nr:serine/threonine-protein kinase [Myxococcota bacterium]
MIENRTHIESGITLSRDPLVGEVIDRYRLVEAVGDGAMANVYRAQHTTLTDRRYAIKVLRPNIASKPQVAERFRREARILSQLEHPNIISVIDAGTTSHGLLYMVLDYAEGPTLKDLMRSDEKMSMERTVDVVTQILSALKRIHALGYIHRDIKPDNIVITKSEGRDLVKILDFGIAGMAQADPDLTRLTEVNRICGTPHYMAPEQASASEILAPVDIYAVGAILYEILEGRPPFVGPLTEVLVQKLVADPKPPESGGNLSAMTMSMLERDPEARPTAARLLAQLRKWKPDQAMNASSTEITDATAKSGFKSIASWQRALGQTLVAAGIASLCAYAGFKMVRSHQTSAEVQQSALISSPIDAETSAIPHIADEEKVQPKLKLRKKLRKVSRKAKQKSLKRPRKKVLTKKPRRLSDSLKLLEVSEVQSKIEELDFIEEVSLQSKSGKLARRETQKMAPIRAKPAENLIPAATTPVALATKSKSLGKTAVSKPVPVPESKPVVDEPSREEIAQARAELEKIRRRAFSERKRVSAYRMQAN